MFPDLGILSFASHPIVVDFSEIAGSTPAVENRSFMHIGPTTIRDCPT